MLLADTMILRHHAQFSRGLRLSRQRLARHRTVDFRAFPDSA
jgi:hypothetical protein